jgi:hypothetical protein
MSMSSIETVPMVIDGTTSSVKYYAAPPSVPSRLVGMRVSTNASQSGEALVEAGLSGNTNPTFSIDLDSKSTGEMHVADYDSSASDAEKMQEYDNGNPVELNVNLQSSGKVVVYLEFDPMMIGQGQDTLYA